MYAFLLACAGLHILYVFKHYMTVAKTVAVMETQKCSFTLKIKMHIFATVLKTVEKDSEFD